MSEGYLIVATAQRKYFALAATLARSIRFFDLERPICLACDDEELVSEEERRVFDTVVRLPYRGKLQGTEHHLYLDQVSPFERTLYVDADCLVANQRIHACWAQLSGYSVTFCGVKRMVGEWRRGVDVARLRQLFGLDYIVKLNGGVFYFDRSQRSNEFFRIAQDLFEKRREEITVFHGTGGGYANEPIWGVTMAMTGNQPLQDAGTQYLDFRRRAVGDRARPADSSLEGRPHVGAGDLPFPRARRQQVPKRSL